MSPMIASDGTRFTIPATHIGVKLYAVTLSARSESRCPPNVGASTSTSHATTKTLTNASDVLDDRENEACTDAHTEQPADAEQRQPDERGDNADRGQRRDVAFVDVGRGRGLAFDDRPFGDRREQDVLDALDQSLHRRRRNRAPLPALPAAEVRLDDDDDADADERRHSG